MSGDVHISQSGGNDQNWKLIGMVGNEGTLLTQNEAPKIRLGIPVWGKNVGRQLEVTEATVGTTPPHSHSPKSSSPRQYSVRLVEIPEANPSQFPTSGF